jgi:LysM repeat protein
MAIAPLPQQEELALFEMPWPKPALRVASTPDLDETEGVENASGVQWASISELFPAESAQAHGERSRASVYRRRRLLAVVVAIGVLVALALPLRSLGAMTTSGVVTPAGAPAGLGDGMPYVVQSGDTLASIAKAINPNANQVKLISQMRAEVGSSVVVPGEHLILP